MNGSKNPEIKILNDYSGEKYLDTTSTDYPQKMLMGH